MENKEFHLTQVHLDLLAKYGVREIGGIFQKDKNYYTLTSEEWNQLSNVLDEAIARFKKRAKEVLIKAEVSFDNYEEVLAAVKSNMES